MKIYVHIELRTILHKKMILLQLLKISFKYFNRTESILFSIIRITYADTEQDSNKQTDPETFQASIPG